MVILCAGESEETGQNTEDRSATRRHTIRVYKFGGIYKQQEGGVQSDESHCHCVFVCLDNDNETRRDEI